MSCRRAVNPHVESPTGSTEGVVGTGRLKDKPLVIKELDHGQTVMSLRKS